MGQPSLVTLTSTGRALALGTAFAGWLCAGIHLAVTSLSMQSAPVDLLGATEQIDRARYQEALRGGEKYEGFTVDRAQVARWFAWYQCAFLFGAATGGVVFGRVGDWFGRAT